ncbi:hypothetical protein [Selenomonas ruminantium]|uniref:hypothetical protein n=1 Tax=Selenomonas ruminantium TaxID=971 RepID=UPI000934B7E3|nr:hypothetical protein [Selenomonas ruminantium]
MRNEDYASMLAGKETLSAKDKGELEASKHLLEDKVEATFEAGKAKLSAEKSKGKYGASISVRDKQD